MIFILRNILIGLAITSSLSFALADELCLSGNSGKSQDFQIPFTVEPPEAKVLFDGSQIDSKSIGTAAMTVTLRFTEPVCLTRVEASVYNDPKREYNATEAMSVVAVKADGMIQTLGEIDLQAEPLLICGTDENITWGTQAEVEISGAPFVCEYQLTLRKQPQAVQNLWREVVLWGLPQRLEKLVQTPSDTINVSENTYSSMRVTWDEIPADVEYVRVQVQDRNSEFKRIACFTNSPGIIRGLLPGREYEVSTSFVGTVDSVLQNEAEKTVKLPAPLEIRTISDSIGMNFYPGGGGAHQARDDEVGMTRRMIDLMQKAGVKHVRWWPNSPAAAKLYADAGMAFFPMTTFNTPELYAKFVDETDVWLTGTANEPDFQNIFPADFTAPLPARKTAARAFSPEMLIAGPAVGGELDGPGLEYLRQCYEAGLADGIDILDLHPYAKWATPTPYGAVPGCPEGLIESVNICKAMLAEIGQQGTLLIASETGHPTLDVRWPMPTVTSQEQARLIVRTHLCLLASGIKRIFWYAFQDEGLNPLEPEHHFGIVDWYGECKPAYFTYQKMNELLGPAVLEGFETDLQAPVYGVRCRLPESYITPLWDSAGRSEVEISTESEIIRCLDLLGNEITLPQAENNILTLTVNEDVRYVISKNPLRYISSQRLEPPVVARPEIKLNPAIVPVNEENNFRWDVTVTNPFDFALEITLDTSNPFNGPRPTVKATLEPLEQRVIEMNMQGPEMREHRLVSWDISCSWDVNGKTETECRAIYFMVP